MINPPLPPSKIGTIEDLREHLQAAVELEHGTIPPYLSALYSIRPGRNREAAEIIRTVVVQEMLHMVLAANVLNAIGGAPTVAHPDFVPEYPIALPLGDGTPLQVPLQRFSPDTVTTFLKVEQPTPPMHNFDLVLKSAVPVPPGQLANMVKAGVLYPSIGEFYGAIKEGLELLEGEAGKNGGTIFTGAADRQVGPEHFYGAGGRATPVRNLSEALSALEVIVHQGEGFGNTIGDNATVSGQGEIAHYYRFDQLRQSRLYLAKDKPGEPSGAAIVVDYSSEAVFPMLDNPTTASLPPGEVRQRGEAFAETYTHLLKLLHAGLNGDPDRLMASAVAMFDLRRLALELIAHPITPDGKTHAGPCFEFRATHT